MFERGGALATWSLEAEPRLGVAQEGKALAPHRLAYLEYEGPVSGDRGTVRRVETGAFDVVAETADELVVDLRGAHLRGRLRLARVAESQRWALSWTES